MRIVSILALTLFPLLLSAELKQRVDGESISITGSPSKSAKRSKPRSINNSEFDTIIFEVAEKTMLDPLLVKSIIKVESDFNPKAVSRAGAMGLMQLMKGTAKIYKVSNPFDPTENINAGCRHFATLMDQFANDPVLALAAYHAGASRVRKAKGVPPIKETVDYVNAVMQYYNPMDYNQIYASVRKLYMEQNGETIEIHD